MDWYAIRTRPKHEKIVESMLANKGYEVLLPIFKCRRRRPDRFKNILLPLFPGYLFCRFDQHARLPILTTPGVLHVVGSGRVPIPISETEVEDVRRVVNAGFEVEPWPYPEIGHAVYIVDGPLQGVVGVLSAVKNTQRLIVSVTLLRRSVAVEIDRCWAIPAKTYSQPWAAIG